MPLVSAAVLVYVAGLLSGFGGLSLLMPGLAAALIWGFGGTARVRLALAALTTAGLALGDAGRRLNERCVAGASRATELRVTIAAAAAPGAFIAGRASCGARLRLAVVKGSAAEGATVVVRGDIEQARGGLVVTRASIQQVTPAGLLPRWRATLGGGIDRVFGENAPLVRALLIADMGGLSPTIRERFASAGLVHMLSVSGLHVGLIAVAVSLVAQVAGVARRRADACVITLTATYVLVIGAPLPAVRAAAMLGAVSLGAAVQRPTSPWAVLAVSAIVPLVDPASATDLGFQLSMVGMVALVASGVLVKRVPWLGASGWRGTLLRSITTSIMATLITSPLVAATFGRVSLVAPVTNVVAVPVMAVLQPMLFLAALALPFGPAARFVADACHPLIVAIEWIAVAGANLPGASIPVVTDRLGLLLATTAATAFVLACVVRLSIRAVLLGAACVAVLAWRPLAPSLSRMTELHMIDVGQGDAVALRTTRGNWVLFDAGRDWQGGDAGRRDVVPYLGRRGGTLVGFVLSHPHSDHVGGAASVLQALRPAWYVDPGYAGATPSYRSSLMMATQLRIAWRRVRPGDSLVVDEATLTFLAPDSTWAETLRDPNDASTVVLVRIGSVRFLLTGDAERDEEAWLLAHQRVHLDADVLKVAHHGSATSSTADFLSAVTPRLALVSVGAGNIYRHPSADVMRALAMNGAVTMRTDRHGSIVVRTDGLRLEVEAEGERWVLK